MQIKLNSKSYPNLEELKKKKKMLKDVNKEVSQRLNNNSDAEAIQNYKSQKLKEDHILANESNSFVRDDSLMKLLIKRNLCFATKADNATPIIYRNASI